MARASRSSSQRFPVDSGVAEIRWDGPRATLLLDSVESSCIDVDDPTRLEFEYMQHMTCALNATFPQPQPVKALHLGGAACALATAWALSRPRSRQNAVEIDAALAQLVREEFPIPRAPELKIRIGDARAVLEGARPSSFDVIVRDAFADALVPEHLRTSESAQHAYRVLRPGGLYLLNCAHGAGSDARIDLAAVAETFDSVCSIQDPKVGRSGRRGNVVLVASKKNEDGAIALDVDELDRLLRRLPLPARVMRQADLGQWRAGMRPLVDELIGWPKLNES